MDPLLQETSQSMDKAISFLQQDLATVRTGRATPSLVEGLVISVYGGSTKMKLMELATTVASDAQTLMITPFDPSILDEIQKGIMEANTGLTPSSDGHVLRIAIPALSEERRQELVKLMHQKLENARIMVRQARQDGLQDVKKNEDLSEDDVKRLEKDIQRLTDEHIATIDGLGKAKESELMQL